MQVFSDLLHKFAYFLIDVVHLLSCNHRKQQVHQDRWHTNHKIEQIGEATYKKL